MFGINLYIVLCSILSIKIYLLFKVFKGNLFAQLVKLVELRVNELEI
jgi:hypothetical protein